MAGERRHAVVSGGSTRSSRSREASTAATETGSRASPSSGSEFGPEGITVNVVAPGYVAETEFFAGRMTPERERGLVEQTALRRASHPEDVAETILFLTSDGARHVTGELVQVNGGALFGR